MPLIPTGWHQLQMQLPFPLYSFSIFELDKKWYMFGGKSKTNNSSPNINTKATPSLSNEHQCNAETTFSKLMIVDFEHN